MDSQTLPDDWVPRYLRLLGAEREAPSLAALTHLTRAQILTVPFGNITSLLRYREHGSDVPALDFDGLLRQWERHEGSAVCFEGTEAFGQLLTQLGYDARPVPGLIGGFMGGHQALLVTLAGARYLVDVANGAPLFDPIPLGEPVEVRHAGLAYRFLPGEQAGEYLQERWIAPEWASFCRYELREQEAEEREGYYRRHHVPRESCVVELLRLVRATPERVISLRGSDLTVFTAAGKQSERLTAHADYERAVRDVFGLPKLPIIEALRVIEGLDDMP